MSENTIDESGVTQKEARFELQTLLNDGFDGDRHRAAVALGREDADLTSIIAGDMEIDDDLAMKVRRMTQTRLLVD
ncbi:MAG: hypothetical protein ABJA02_14235 [Acidobacteriota bacterium]